MPDDDEGDSLHFVLTLTLPFARLVWEFRSLRFARASDDGVKWAGGRESSFHRIVWLSLTLFQQLI